MLTNSPIGVALHDREMRYIRVNAALAGITGSPVAAHTGKMLRDIASEDMADAVEPYLEEVRRSGEPITNVPISASSKFDPLKERHFLCVFMNLPGRTVGLCLRPRHTIRQLEEQLPGE